MVLAVTFFYRSFTAGLPLARYVSWRIDHHDRECENEEDCIGGYQLLLNWWWRHLALKWNPPWAAHHTVFMFSLIYRNHLQTYMLHVMYKFIICWLANHSKEAHTVFTWPHQPVALPSISILRPCHQYQYWLEVLPSISPKTSSTPEYYVHHVICMQF